MTAESQKPNTPELGQGLRLKLEPNEALLKSLKEHAEALNGVRDGIKSSVAEVKQVEVGLIYESGHKDGLQQGIFGTALVAVVLFVVFKFLGGRHP